MGRSTPTTAFDGKIWYFHIQCGHIEHMHEGVWIRKNIFLQNDSCELRQFSLIRLLYLHRWCLHGPINSYHSFEWSNLILCLYNIDTLNICMKEFGSEKKMTKWQLWELRQFFPYMASVYACIVPSWANQLLPQLSMEQFNTLPLQYRYIEHMHEGVWFRKNNFWQNDSCELRQFFPNKAFVYAKIVPTWADQLLPQLLMEQFDTLPIQWRHIEHMHEGVWFWKNIFLIKWQLRELRQFSLIWLLYMHR